VPSDRLIDYYEAGHCSMQWRGFLHALANEFSDALPWHDLRRLMARIGARYASDYPLERYETLDEWCLAVNRCWQKNDFGFAVVRDQNRHLEIRHYGAPLFLAMGMDKAQWAVGFLEGVYYAWFVQAGMGTGLEVRAETPEADNPGDRSTCLRLVRASVRNPAGLE